MTWGTWAGRIARCLQLDALFLSWEHVSPSALAPLSPLSPLLVANSETHCAVMPACPVLLALLPVPGSGGCGHRQLLHHCAHHPGRPLCEGPADPGTGCLLHLYSCWQVSSTLDPLSGVVNRGPRESEQGPGWGKIHETLPLSHRVTFPP